MKNFFIIFVLLLIIAATSLFSFFYIVFNLLPYDNSLNQSLRPYVLKQEVLRNLLKLHQVGDARYQYFLRPLTQIEITIFVQEGETLEPETLEKIKKPLIIATKKRVPIRIKESTILTNVPDSVTSEVMNTLLNTYAVKKQFTAKTIPLNIFVLREHAEHPSLAGMVIDDTSLFLFKKMITLVSDHQQSSLDAEVSTILHEFAHLSGAEHIPNDSCILAEKIENIDLFNRPAHFQDSFCSEDLQEIQKHL